MLEHPDHSLERRYRECIGNFATGVTIVTASSADQRAGMTLNAFTSVSLAPLLILISLAHNTRTLTLIRDARKFAVSILHDYQHAVALEFAANGAKFPEHHTIVDDEGFVTVRDALAVVQCTVHAIVAAGDHDLVIGAVTGFDAVEGKPLVFHRGAFGTLGDSIQPAATKERR
jgi:flavin reductase (DIM6/NTAB) family NADH-FMN oxidoreductase RutF